jgi:hypothetical protein
VLVRIGGRNNELVAEERVQSLRALPYQGANERSLNVMDKPVAVPFDFVSSERGFVATLTFRWQRPNVFGPHC